MTFQRLFTRDGEGRSLAPSVFCRPRRSAGAAGPGFVGGGGSSFAVDILDAVGRFPPLDAAHFGVSQVGGLFAGVEVMDDARLRTVWQQRRPGQRASHVSQPLQMLMKYRLAKRVRQLSRMAEVWDEVVPDELREHTALERLDRGTLTVMVDSAAHRYRLQMLLNGGLLKEIQRRFPDALNKVRLLPGQFFAVDVAGMPRYGYEF